MSDSIYMNSLLDIWDAADAAIDGHVVAIYSAYPVVDQIPQNNLDNVAFCGKIRFVGTSTYGGVEGIDYESAVVENPKWIDLHVLANGCMLKTNDHHHCFFEGFDIISEDDVSSIGKFSLGS